MYVKNFSGKEEWLPGIVSKVQGPLSYLILLDDGRVLRRHVDHVKLRETISEPSSGPAEPEGLEEVVDVNDVIPERPVRSRKPPSRLIEELET